MTKNKSLFNWVARGMSERGGMDFQILATLLFRSWSVLAGAVTIVVVPIFLSPVQLGYYYTFTSILALQVFFELGMGQVIVQIVAHEAVHVFKNTKMEITGDERRVARLAIMQRIIRRWYLIAAVLFFFAVVFIGFLFFRGGELGINSWLFPWILLVLVTACNLYQSWRLAFEEGFGAIAAVARVRLYQSVLGFFSMWAALFAGAGLWAVFVVPFVALIYSVSWLRRNKSKCEFSGASANTLFSWREEIFPFQWKIALSWISGFFIFQLFVPIVFKSQGASEAGRLGLGISIFNAVSTVGNSWVIAKVPFLAGLISEKKNAVAWSAYKKLATWSLVFVTTAGIILICSGAILRSNFAFAGDRLPSVTVLVFLGAVSILNSFIFPAATFMRAHKEEPMLLQSVILAVAISVSVYYLAPFGTAWAVGSYMAITLVIGMPWTLFLLRGYSSR